MVAEELVCKGNNIIFKPFGEGYLLQQRLEAPVVSPRASACYTPIQDLESKQLLKNLLSSNDFPNIFERFTASVVYSITFGMRIVTGEEWQLKESHECLQNILIAGQFGSWIVNSIPILNYLPNSLAPWKKTAESWHQKWSNLHTTNFRDALNRPGWNWSKDFKNAKEFKQMTELEVAWAAGILCDAGVETTLTQMQIFILACLSSPSFISCAQKELDEIVGHQRLPDFHDLDKLPYIHAIIEESFRWRHLVPAGIPHATIQEDNYNGYRIPKGSIVFPLFSAMRKDSNLYQNPEAFQPERWLVNKSQPNNFGYGRRVCPGRFIASNSLAIAIARLLWAFNIHPEHGREKFAVRESMFTTGLVSGPKPFAAVFEPRSRLHKQVIEDSFDTTEKDVAVLLDIVRSKQVASGISPRA